MAPIRVGLMGFGRIGRNLFRILYKRDDIRIGAISDTADPTALEYLLRFEGQVVSRETLAREVWQERGRTPTLDNVIDAHVARLRKKVDADASVKLIHTVRGVGFVVREEAA